MESFLGRVLGFAVTAQPTLAIPLRLRWNRPAALGRNCLAKEAANENTF